MDQNTQELLRQIQELQHKLSYDELTGLLSRQAFYEHFEGEVSKGDVLLFIDLDDFKSVNDGYGFLVGDNLLTLISSAIAQQVADRGKVFRLAGDEFLVSLRKSHAHQAKSICNEILAVVRSSTIDVGDLTISRGASIGMTVIKEGMLAREAIGAANNGLRVAKENGKNQVRVINERRKISTSVRPNIEEVRLGLQRNEIGYHLQPMIDLERSEIWGYEALLRWHRPDGQILGPIHFLETMTQAYNIETEPPLKAAHAVADWVTIRHRKMISFNISTEFIASVSMHGLDWVNELVGDIPYEKVVFELVETLVSSDEELISRAVGMLRELGLLIAIDDFGVGQSTISRLRSTPVDYVKIDRQFLHSARNSERERTILQGMIDLAHSSGAESIVEGIETPEDLLIVRETSARFAQGFYLGRPHSSEYLETKTPAYLAGVLR